MDTAKKALEVMREAMIKTEDDEFESMRASLKAVGASTDDAAVVRATDAFEDAAPAFEDEEPDFTPAMFAAIAAAK